MTVTNSRLHLAAAVAMLLLIAGAGCSAPMPQNGETETDRPETVRHERQESQEGSVTESNFEYGVRRGEEFSFDLAGREGVDAKRWMVDYDRNLFEFVRDEFRPSRSVQGEGRHFFVFRARSTGGGRITFSYGDPRSGGEVEERINYVVRIDP